MKHNASIGYMLAFVGLVSVVIIATGIRHKRRGDVILGVLIIFLCALALGTLEFF